MQTLALWAIDTENVASATIRFCAPSVFHRKEASLLFQACCGVGHVIMSKAWSLRYALVRAQLGWEETLNHLTTSTASLPDAIAKGLEVYRKELTKVILFTGSGLAYQTCACSTL